MQIGRSLTFAGNYGLTSIVVDATTVLGLRTFVPFPTPAEAAFQLDTPMTHPAETHRLALLRSILALAAWCAITTAVSPAAAEDPPALHAVIDQLLQPLEGVAPQLCSDAEFLRRVSLDLVGMPPTAEEARVFLADAEPDKRRRLVDRLLQSPHHAQAFRVGAGCHVDGAAGEQERRRRPLASLALAGGA